MYNQYYSKLLPPANLSHCDVDHLTGRVEMKMNLSMINDKIHEWLASINIAIHNARCLYKAPGISGSLHIDRADDVHGNISRLNWVFGGEDGYTEWFKPLPDYTPIAYPNYLNEMITTYDTEKCTSVCKAYLNGLNLINTGVPHIAKNGQSSPRYCYAFFIKDLHSKNDLLTYPEALARLQPWVTNIAQ